MTDNVENLIIVHLTALRSEVKEMRNEMHAEFKDVKHRLTQLEGHTLGSRRDAVAVQEDVYRQQATIDSITERLTRIERRLELA